ncbi:ABC transporter permease [Spirilliplanes yamanashiensis]|uniref:ABC transporter permease n=1 Tax=Spirilliplanes yamanashiensis TaxID=42233 RepID=A0A8J4DN11_9ACTN|nr:ABC transporter permease [Spirilliplanes yamanashiensis]MDP9818223.1 ABC-2 type transport system permease protein [Spirilliplanes yamanashiensis]GIJ06749.1 ABC transporter permease [Spirilliplanes yamanashiensis]
MRQHLSPVWTIARRELTTRARSKAFRIASAVLLAGIVLGILVPAWAMSGTARFTVVVAGGPAGLPAAVSAEGAAAGLAVTARPAGDRAAAVRQVETGAADAALVAAPAPGELVWRTTEEARLAPVLTAALDRLAAARHAEELGLTPAELDGLLAPADPRVTRLDPQPDRSAQLVIATVGMILLFVALNFYGSYVLTGVVEEKSSRVVEVLLARVRPADLLAGKVLGIGILGIGQFAVLAAVAAVTLQVARPPRLPGGTVSLIAAVVLWFVLGYGFYSVLYGALGALASRAEDAQVAAAPLTGFLMLAYFGAFTAVADPARWWITAASMFPPTAPIYMPLRSALTDVPAWQTGAAVLLMIVAIGVLVRVGGRLYRGAVLHTGGRLRIRQAWRGAV